MAKLPLLKLSQQGKGGFRDGATVIPIERVGQLGMGFLEGDDGRFCRGPRGKSKAGDGAVRYIRA